jgi:hypothetical protein
MWGTPANEEMLSAIRTNRPPNLRRVTDSVTLQTMLNGMNETAQALQRQNTNGGSFSAPLSPTTLNPRSHSGWPQSDSRAVPPENVVHPEHVLAGEFCGIRCIAEHAGLDNRTTVMVKDVPVSDMYCRPTNQKNKLSRQELVDILNQVSRDPRKRSDNSLSRESLTSSTCALTSATTAT